MNWINSALVGVVAGGALTYGSTVLTNRSTAQRDDRKAQAEARAKRQEEWAAFQYPDYRRSARAAGRDLAGAGR